MTNKVYVGNLNYDTEELTLRDLFAEHGTVTSVRIITDRYTGLSRGFGFVEMGTSEEAQAAIGALDGKEVDGRALKVSEAREPSRRDSRQY
jgi:RNA recognition motif-containing protein